MGARYWVLTSASLITTSSMSVAEDYYKNKPAQVLKGRVVKTPRLWGVSLVACESEFKLSPHRSKNRLEHYKDDIILYLLLESDVRGCASVTFAGADSGSREKDLL